MPALTAGRAAAVADGIATSGPGSAQPMTRESWQIQAAQSMTGGPSGPRSTQPMTGGPWRTRFIASAGVPRHQPSASTHQVSPAAA